MASFREMCFTPAEFATIAKCDRAMIPVLENQGILKTIKRRVGNVDRKMVTLEDMQQYFRNLRNGRHGDQIPLSPIDGDGAIAAAPAVPSSLGVDSVAAATGFGSL